MAGNASDKGTKKTRSRSSKELGATAETPGAPNAPRPAAIVRTYRHGLGDCHLLTLTSATGRKFRMLIDCGVILGTTNAQARMSAVMKDVIEESGGTVDVLVATHRHWDHVSGFVQAADDFARLKVGQVWLGWTENPRDPDAAPLRKQQADALAMLQPAAARMHLAASAEPTLLATVLEFFGAAGAATTDSAMDALRAKGGATLRYCDPKDAPFELSDFGARIYVLGPPRDEAFLKKMLPAKTDRDETYHLAADAFAASVAAAAASLGGNDEDQPFGGPYRIPDVVARGMPFFQARYWDDEGGSDGWRSIDLAWMDSATQLALMLDNLVNNTSLVLAVDLGTAGVLLFAADAQVGNWESWRTQEWTVGGTRVVVDDLLKRTVLYKVGHHGSYNATLRKGGLESMSGLRVALIPVDHSMAVKKRWGDIPLNTLVAALEQTTGAAGYVLRSDAQPSAQASARGARSTDLYFEVTVD